MKWGIAGGVVAGLGAIAWSEDRLFDRGPATGAIIPATLGGAALGTLALGVAARGGWRWAGSPMLSSLSHASGPIGVAALGGAIGVGTAALFDQLFPGGDGVDPSAHAADDLREQAGEIAKQAARQERQVASKLEDANRRLDGKLDDLDKALEANGGRMGAEGTVGEGRLDVTGMSPQQAADLVFDAYAPGREQLDAGVVRVDGANVFTLPWIAEDDPVTRDELVAIFADDVDTTAPEGTISAEESRRWQLGEHRETRTRGEDGGDG